MGLEESCPTVVGCPMEIYADRTHDGTLDQRLAEVEEEGHRQ
jgi:hypothetical protein